MRKLSVIAIVLVAALVFGGVTASAAKKPQKVKSQVSLKYNSGPYEPYEPYYEEAVLKGKVKAKGKASNKARKVCKSRRTVTIRNEDGRYARVKTDKKGRYSVPASDAYTEPGQYRAVVSQKKKGKGKKKITCKGAVSAPVVVAAP